MLSVVWNCRMWKWNSLCKDFIRYVILTCKLRGPLSCVKSKQDFLLAWYTWHDEDWTGLAPQTNDVFHCIRNEQPSELSEGGDGTPWKDRSFSKQQSIDWNNKYLWVHFQRTKRHGFHVEITLPQSWLNVEKGCIDSKWNQRWLIDVNSTFVNPRWCNVSITLIMLMWKLP